MVFQEYHFLYSDRCLVVIDWQPFGQTDVAPEDQKMENAQSPVGHTGVVFDAGCGSPFFLFYDTFGKRNHFSPGIIEIAGYFSHDLPTSESDQ
jgi:hypothetical protein